MSKLVKSVKKGLSKLVSGVKKVFKKAWDNKYVRGALIVGAVWLGGAALGAWSSPFQGVNGALAKGAASNASSVAATGEAAKTASLAQGATLNTGEALAALSKGAGATAPVPGVNLGATAAQKTLAAAGPGATPATTATGSAVAPVVQSAGAGKGLIGKTAGKIANFVKDNKTLSVIGINALAGAAGNDEMDILEKQYALRDQERQRREGNLDVSEINLGLPEAHKPLTDLQGQSLYGRGGLINPVSLQGT